MSVYSLLSRCQSGSVALPAGGNAVLSCGKSLTSECDGGDGCLSNLVEEARAAHTRAVDMLQQVTGEAAADVEGHD